MSESALGPIEAHRRQIRDAPRPAPLAGTDIRGQVAETAGAAEIVRVYVWETTYAYTSTGVGPVGRAECEAVFAKVFAGRVRLGDVFYAPSIAALPDDWPWRLVIRRPNVRGEFKTRELALAYVRDEGLDLALPPGSVSLVAKNGREDHALRDYGVKKLVDQ